MTTQPTPQLPDSSNKLATLAWLSLVIGCALFGLQYQWQPRPALHAGSSPGSGSLPDTVVTEAILDTYDTTGQHVRRLSGQRISFFESEQRSVVSEPRMEVAAKPGSKQGPWQLSATTATLYSDKQQVDLEGNVVLWTDSAAEGRTSIKTEQLSVDTDKRFAHTDKAVTIRARNSEATANGLQADLANEHLVLPSRVRETHVVRH